MPTFGSAIDLHADGERFAVSPLPTEAELESGVRQDKVVFIFNFFDELRRLADEDDRND